MGGRKCCVPNCKSNYGSTSGYVTVFRFPKQPELTVKWVEKIGRYDFIPNKNTVVCIKHFEKDSIITHDILPRPDGDIKILRGIPKLKDGACPTIFEESLVNESNFEAESAASVNRPNELKQVDVEAYLQAWMDANDIENTEELRNECDNVVSEWDYIESVQENNSPKERRSKNSRLVEDFLIPALNYKTYGDLLMWDPVNPSCFLLSWTHKAASAWSLQQAAVFAAWDEIKGRPVPKNTLDFVYSKQRMRAALKAAKNIEGVKGVGGYRRYKILNLDNYVVQQDWEYNYLPNRDENIPNNTQYVLKDLNYEDYAATSSASPKALESEKKELNPSGKQDSPSGKQDSPSGKQDSPSGKQDSPSGKQDSPSGKQDSPSGKQDSPSGKQNSPSAKQSLPSEKQNCSEMVPYSRHTRSLTQKIVEICPDSEATLFEEIDEDPKPRKKNPPKRSVEEAFHKETNGCQAPTESTESKGECSSPKKRKPQTPKKRKKRVRRFTTKKKPPSKNLRKWKRPKKITKINLKEFSFKKGKVFQKKAAPLQYSVLENESLYWKTLDQIATQCIKQEPIDNFAGSVSEKANELPVKSEPIVPESSNAVLNHDVKPEPTEELTEDIFFSEEEEDEESEYESDPPSPASDPDPDTSTNASHHQDLKSSGHSLIGDFVIPALDKRSYGDLLKWDSYDPSVFWIKWTHKAKSSWCRDEAAVFIAWDKFKGRRTPKTPLDFVEAKQRLRAAFRNLKTVEHVQMKKGYRGYRILALAGVESVGERKLTVQKYLKEAQEMEEEVSKIQAPAKPKVKDMPKPKVKDHVTKPKVKAAQTKPKLKPPETKLKLKDHLKKKECTPSTSSKLNSSELLDSYHHHTRSLTRKMVEISPRRWEQSKRNGLKLSISEEKENFSQTSKFSKPLTCQYKSPAQEIDSTDIYHDIHLIREANSSVRYNDTHDTSKVAHPVSNFNNSSSYETDSPAGNSDIPSESSDWEPGSKRENVRKPRITKHAVDPKDFPLMAKSRKTLQLFRTKRSLSKQKAHLSSDSLLYKALTTKMAEDSGGRKCSSKQNKSKSLVVSSESDCDSDESEIYPSENSVNACETQKKRIPNKQKHSKRSKMSKSTSTSSPLNKCLDYTDLDDDSSAIESESEELGRELEMRPSGKSKRGKSSFSKSSSDVESSPKSRKKFKNKQDEQNKNVDPFYQYENIIKDELQRINGECLSSSELSDALSSSDGSYYTDESQVEEEVRDFIMREKIKAGILNSEKPIDLNSEEKYISFLPQCSVSLKRDSITDNGAKPVPPSERNRRKGDPKRKKQEIDLKANTVEARSSNMNENNSIIPQSIPDDEDASKKNLLMEFSYFVDEYNRKNALVGIDRNNIQTECSENSPLDIKIVDICSVPVSNVKSLEAFNGESERPNSCQNSIYVTHEEQNVNSTNSSANIVASKLCNVSSCNEVEGEVLNCNRNLNSNESFKSNLISVPDKEAVNFNPNSNGNEINSSKFTGGIDNLTSSSPSDFQSSEATVKDDESDIEVIEILVKDPTNYFSEKYVTNKDSVTNLCGNEYFKLISVKEEKDSIARSQERRDNFNKSIENEIEVGNVIHQNVNIEASEPNAFVEVKNSQNQRTENTGGKNASLTTDQKIAESCVDERVSKVDDVILLSDDSNKTELICSESQDFRDKILLPETEKSTNHNETCDDCVVLQLTPDARCVENHVNAESLHNYFGSSSENNSNGTKMYVSEEANSLKCLEDDCVIVNNVSVCSMSTEKSANHNESCDDYVVLQHTPDAKNVENRANTESLHNDSGSTSKNNSNETKTCVSEEANSLKCLEDDCVIVNNLSVCSMSTERSANHNETCDNYIALQLTPDAKNVENHANTESWHKDIGSSSKNYSNETKMCVSEETNSLKCLEDDCVIVNNQSFRSMSTEKSANHNESCDDYVVLQHTPDAKNVENCANTESLHNDIGSNSKNNSNETKMCVSEEANSLKCLEDDCVIVDNLSVSLIPSEPNSAFLSNQQTKTNIATNDLNVDALTKEKCEKSHCIDKNNTRSVHEILSRSLELLDDECIIVSDECSALNDRTASQIGDEAIENFVRTINRDSLQANASSHCSVQETMQTCSAMEHDQSKTKNNENDPDTVEDDCVILSDESNEVLQNKSSDKRSQFKPDEATVFELLNTYKKECLSYQKLIQTANISDSEIKLILEVQAKKLELISRLVENSDTLDPSSSKRPSNSSTTANESIKTSENQVPIRDEFPKLMRLDDPNFHIHASSRLKQPSVENSCTSPLNSDLAFAESFTEDRTESTCESSGGKQSKPWAVSKDAKCTVCQRPADSACYYCCVVYYCSAECAESLVNKSHYESCKDEYLSKLNVTRLHRPIAEKQPCL